MNGHASKSYLKVDGERITLDGNEILLKGEIARKNYIESDTLADGEGLGAGLGGWSGS